MQDKRPAAGLDFKIFVPRGTGINYIDICGEEVRVASIDSMNIKFIDDMAGYWLTILIEEDQYNLKKKLIAGSKYEAKLLFGNSSYYIVGHAEIFKAFVQKWDKKTEVNLYFDARNISKTIHNSRPAIEINKFELMDLEE